MLLRRIGNFFRLQKQLGWDAGMVEKHQVARLKYILAHAQETVPFYRDLFGTTGFSVDSFQCLADVARVPFTRKEHIRSLPVAERISTRYAGDRLIHHVTGGTTGKSLDIYCNAGYEDLRVASIFRVYAYHGYRPTDRIAVVMFYPVLPRVTEKLGLFRRVGYAYGMDAADIVNDLVTRNFEVLEGYPSRLRSIAEYVMEKHIGSIRPRAVFSNSEMLDEATRLIIQQAFGVRPINVFESWEFSQIAWECSLGIGLHVNADLKYVEVCDARGNAVYDAPGEVVITDLYNDAMPFIRYCTGDEGILTSQKCPCGSSFPVLKSILGRTNDRLVLRDGKESISVTPLFANVKITPGVIEHQAIQEQPGEIVILTVCNEQFTREVEEEMKQRILTMYALVHVEVRRVPAIERTGVGKQRAFVSKLSRA